MSRLLSIIGLCAVLYVAALPAPVRSDDAAVRFAALDIYLDASEPFAAWQFELSAGTGQMLVVGVENGESAAFEGTPYYDLEAVRAGVAERIIVADFTIKPASELPSGRVRIATVHVRLNGPAAPDYALRLITAANEAGEPIMASIHLDIQKRR